MNKKNDIDFLYEFVNIKNKYLNIEKNNLKFETLKPNKLRDKIDLKLNSNSISKEKIIKLIEEITLATFSSSSKRFFNQLFGGREDVSILADMLVPLMNISMYTYKIADIQILIEKEIILKLSKKFGFENGDGIFTPGGSISNLQAMIIARNQKIPNILEDGFSNSNQKLITYTSCESHYSILKNAGIIGIGKNNIRFIKTNNLGQMDFYDLEKNIKIDLENNHIPFFINATSGTTVTGNFDNLCEISKIGIKYNIYLHVDASFGGGVIFSEKYKYLMKGCKNFDSISFDAHKMMGVPLNSSIFLTKEKNLEKNFNESADYLYQDNNDEYNLGKKSIQCGRRNDAFKFWAVYKYLGDFGLENRINKQFELKDYALKYILNNLKLNLGVDPQSICLCFEVIGKSSSKICDRLNEKGLFKIGYGSFKNKNYLRLVLVNPQLEKKDINYFFKEVIKISEEI